MISHTTLGTNDLVRAEQFFDEILPFLNGKKLMNTDRAVFYAFGGNGSKLAISQPFDGQPATQGNGTMVAFSASSIEDVKVLHSKAISLGATNEGDPGERHGGLYYGAYFRDLDGNKFAIFHLLSKPKA
ncbi:VOC family protein [Microbulbifer epialgicus]|uniref:VOC family protein n=1 Tax=Microbulbifer epialgicus TaxID=393907 RepID=A0ABV4P7K1_9GAMM